MNETISLKRSSVAMPPAFLSSDGRLVRQAATGDQRAATAIYERYGQDLYRYCQAILGNPQDAQDALQNCFAKAFRALEGESREIQLKPWLYRIAFNESIDLIRARRPTDEIDPDEEAPGPTPHQTLEEQQRLKQLVGDIGALPERQRGALVMRELSGMSFEEIGGAFDASPAVVRQTIYEARIGLREMEAGREMSCEHVKKSLSDNDGRVLRRRDVRAHLRACADCKVFEEGIAARRKQLNGLAPLSPVVSAGILQGLLGGHGGAGGAGGGGLLGFLGGSSGATIGASAVAKSAAVLVAASAVGGYAANVTGLVHIPVAGAIGGHSKKMGGAADSRVSSAEQAAAVRFLSSRRGTTAANVVDGARAQHPSGPGGDGGRPGGPVRPADGSPEGPPPASGSDSESVALEDPGKGRSGTLPAASTHGQETAASHAPELPAQAQAGSPHPPHPPHPPSAGGPGGSTPSPPSPPPGQSAGGPPKPSHPQGTPSQAQGGPPASPGSSAGSHGK